MNSPFLTSTVKYHLANPRDKVIDPSPMINWAVQYNSKRRNQKEY